jgi:hypothetical protein
LGSPSTTTGEIVEPRGEALHDRRQIEHEEVGG